VVLFELVLYVQYHKTKQTHSKYCIFIDISYKYTTEKKRKIILKFELLDAGTPPAPSSSAIMGKAKKDRAAKRGADGGGSAASSKNNTPSKKAKVRETSPDADSTGNATATASDEEPTEVGKQVCKTFFISIYCFQINILTIVRAAAQARCTGPALGRSQGHSAGPVGADEGLRQAEGGAGGGSLAEWR